MNQLKMDIQQTISTLSRGGWSQRRIARELGIDRETVARYRRLARQLAEPKPAISPAGSELVNDDYSSPQCQLKLTVTPAYL
jgi:transcriptional regulator with XRE-family HTH domain